MCGSFVGRPLVFPISNQPAGMTTISRPLLVLMTCGAGLVPCERRHPWQISKDSIKQETAVLSFANCVLIRSFPQRPFALIFVNQS